MWNEPSAQELAQLPQLYASENTPPEDTLVHMHFFLGRCDWYMAEYGPTERIFFGFAILNNDLVNAEWGLIPYDELRDVSVRGIEVDRDLHWRAKKASKVDRIVAACPWYRRE